MEVLPVLHDSIGGFDAHRLQCKHLIQDDELQCQDQEEEKGNEKQTAKQTAKQTVTPTTSQIHTGNPTVTKRVAEKD